jgi:integrase
MTVRKLKGSWWVDLQFSHRRYRKRSPENSRAGALVYEATLRRNLSLGITTAEQEPTAAETETFELFAPKWFREYVQPNNKYSEQRTKKTILTSSLVPFFGKMLLVGIAARDIERFKAHQINRGLKAKTITNQLTVLNKCLGTAYEWLELNGAPPRIKWPKCAPPQFDYLSPEECELLSSRASGVVKEMILAALRTGMRQGELKGLQWSSIDWQNQTVSIRHSRDDYMKELVSPKSNRERHIPLDADLLDMLQVRKRSSGYVFLDTDGMPFDNKRLARRMRKLCKETGLRRIGWHTLRHTFASHLVTRGVPLAAVKELLGHTSIVTTMRYAHLAPSTLRAAIDMLNAKTVGNVECGQPSVNPWIETQLKQAAKKNRSAVTALIS